MGIALARTEDGDSPRFGLDLLEQAPEHAREVAEVLREFRYVPYSAVVPDGAADYGDMVEQAVVAEGVDVLVVHLVGHGELAEGSSEKLYVLGSDGERLDRPVGAWVDQIEDHPGRHRPLTLFVLDVCYAGEAAVTSWHARMDVAERRAWVLAATGPKDQAFGYRLSRALVSVLGKYRDREVRIDASVRYIPPNTVWQEIARTVNDLTVQDGGLPQTVLTSLVPSHADLSHLPFFPNPCFDAAQGAVGGTAAGLPGEIARLADWATDPQHFVLRAGGAEPVARDWDEGYFSGRAEELHELSGWLDDEAAGPGLRVVTGKPGAGKSALLGVLVCAAHPGLRRHTKPLWRGLGDRAPGENDRIAVVHARRLGVEQIVASLARQLQHIGDPGSRPSEPDGDREGPAANPVDHLLGLLPGDGRPVTVIVDALDEAIRPQDITTTLLLPLARRAQTPGSRIRLLVGTRDDERFHSLLALARGEDACTDLSAAPPEVVRQDVTEYVGRLLAADGPYALGARRTAREALARAIAARLTEAEDGAGDGRALQWGEFLTAGLYVHYLLVAEQPCDTPQAAAELGKAAPRSLPALMELDLRRHTGQLLLHAVLTVLAFAQGRGMPERVLAHAAAAFTTDPTHESPLPLQEIYTLLDHEARFYLRRDVDEDGTTLYRLFHEGLAEWLRQPLNSQPLRPHAAERLYEQLLNSVPRDSAGQKLWHLAAPYLLRHTAQHAVDAGHLDDLLQDGEFLVHADPHSLADALSNAESDLARLNAAVYRASWGVHHALPPAARRQLLALDAARYRNQHLQAALPGDADWHVRWATGSQISQALVRTLIGHAGPVHSVAVAQLDGRLHAVTTSDDRSVRVWDLTTGIQIRHFTGHAGPVHSVAVAQLGGRSHAVTTSFDGSVRVWDLTTGIQIRHLTGHAGPVYSVVVSELDGRLHAVTTSDDRSVRVWDLTTGIQIRHLTGHTGPVIAVAVAELDGRPHAVTTSRDESVRVWDLATGKQVRSLTGHAGPVYSVVVSELDGRPHAVTTSVDGSVRVWDLAVRAQVRSLAGHTGPVIAVVVSELDGRPHAVTTSVDGSVRVWDLATGAQIYHFTGHTDPVYSVVAGLGGYPHGAVAELGGRPHAVTISGSRSVRVWDLTTGAQTHQLTGHGLENYWVNSVAVVELEGRPHAVTTNGVSVQVWDLATGYQTHDLTGHAGMVTSVAVAELDGRPHAVTTCSDESVRVWDLTTGNQIHHLDSRRGTVTSVAVVELGGRPHAVTTTSDDGWVWVWDLVTGGLAHYLTGHAGMVTSVAVAELDGRPHAVTISYGKAVCVWDLINRSCRATFQLPDETNAVVATADGTVVLGVGYDVVVLALKPLIRRLP
ncbi:hypothetical protein ACFC5Z_02005 [Streptomyces sp. NPDC056004]|uniref:hypothetical protein n=1 Tax=Streptomyces sp. NPDC056004 TaxID=3345677 RepID=UPI0035D5DEBD